MDELTVVRTLASWAIERVRPYEKNARLHSESDVRKLAAHIIRHGFNKPIEVDEEGRRGQSIPALTVARATRTLLSP